jgi:hypothetical protein
MNKPNVLAVVAIASAIAVGGITAGLVITSSPTPPSPPKQSAIAPTTCHPDPTAAIAATPVGGVWQGSGCYLIPNGLVFTTPYVTINGGTFYDLSTGPTKVPGQQLGIHPIMECKSADHVTIENVNVVGAATSSVYNAALVGQAGYSLKSCTNTVMLNDTSNLSMGDCLTLFQDGPNHPVTSNLTVDGFTCSNPGRWGISPSAVYGAVLNNVTLNVGHKPSIDFESDVVGLGAGAITFNNLVAGSGIFVRETLNGPVVFNNSVSQGAITLQNLNSATLFPVTFNGGSLAIGTGAQRTGVSATGGIDVFNGMTFTRQPTATGKPQVSAMWYASQGASLSFNHCVLAPPLGGNDATSKVTVTP